jgi:peptidoglycan/xylan/chitin deacetylase (PgdA/CDA1 family)
MDQRCAPAWILTAVVCVVLLAVGGCAGSAPTPTAHATVPVSTDGVAKPPVVALHRAPREPVPILMYHVIGDTPADARLPALFVSPDDFAAQIEGLARAGYHGVTMQQVHNAWRSRGKLPRRPVVLSFDDGSEGQVHRALPLLRERGWPGVLNLTWRFLPDIGGTSAVRELVRAGWEIDSHSLNHPDLTRLSARELRRELRESRRRIKRAFGARAANFFAYPSGRYDGRVKRAVRAAGYLAATNVKAGFAKPTADPFALGRIQVSGGTTATQLLRRLRDLRP